MKDSSAFIKTISEFAESRQLWDTRNLIVGVSGGPDSIALVTVLSELSNRDIFPRIYVVHVNHQIRQEADADEQLVESYCKKLGVPCFVYSYDVPSKAKELSRSLEETGRILRREAFNDVCQRLNISDYRIALAHHKDDMGETMLMNLFRGSGLDGLVSPEAISGNYIRPLLCVTKSQILEYLDYNNISYAIDKTNYESDCTRNIWRNDIIPEITKVSIKDPVQALSDTYELLEADKNYIDFMADKAYQDVVTYKRGRAFIICSKIANYHLAIKTRVIRKVWESTFGNLTDFAKMHVDKCLTLICSDQDAATTIDLSFGRKAFIASGYFGFASDEDVTFSMCAVAELMGFYICTEHLNVDVAKTTVLPQNKASLEVRIVENTGDLEYNTSSWYCPVYEDGHEELKARNDVLNLKFIRAGSIGSKTVKDLLKDLKVPRQAREYIVAFVKGEDVLWIPNVGHSAGFTNAKSYEAWKNDDSHPASVKYFVRVEVNPEMDGRDED